MEKLLKNRTFYLLVAGISCLIGLVTGWILIRFLVCAIIGFVFSGISIASSILGLKNLKENKSLLIWTVVLSSITALFSLIMIIFSIVA